MIDWGNSAHSALPSTLQSSFVDVVDVVRKVDTRRIDLLHLEIGNLTLKITCNAKRLLINLFHAFWSLSCPFWALRCLEMCKTVEQSRCCGAG